MEMRSAEKVILIERLVQPSPPLRLLLPVIRGTMWIIPSLRLRIFYVNIKKELK